MSFVMHETLHESTTEKHMWNARSICGRDWSSVLIKINTSSPLPLPFTYEPHR